MKNREARERAADVEALLGELDGIADAAARDRALEAVTAVVELYGEGLRRVVSRAGTALLTELVDDDLVSHLLIVHGLHPIAVETRVTTALEEVRPYLASHGGGVELLGVDDGVARLRLEGSCDGCPSSSMTLKLAVEEAIQRAAPEIERVEAAGEPAALPLQLEVSDTLRANAGAWHSLALPPGLMPGHAAVAEVAGEPLLLLSLERKLYAYRPECPGCGGWLASGELRGAELRCPACGNAYDARRAGRCLDSPQLHLDPVPLLEAEPGAFKVALEAVRA